MDRSRLLHALTKTFHLMRVLGFDVRVHWTAFVYLLIALSLYSGTGSGVAGAQSELQPLIFAFAGTLQLFGIVLVHELGHAIAARRLGLGVRHIQLNPLGGLAALDTPPRNPREEIIVTFWGPAVHPVMLMAAAIPYLLVSGDVISIGGVYGEELIRQFFWINAALLGFNLIPAFPLDGGRLLRAYLALRMPAAKATIIAAYVGQVASFVLVIVAVLYGGDFKILLALIGILSFLVCEQTKTMARHVDPYGEGDFGFASFESEFDYGLGGEDDEDEEPRPGFLTRYLQERSERKRQTEARQEADVKARVDELLEKVSEVGIDGLTPAERRFLEKASSLYRRSPSRES